MPSIEMTPQQFQAILESVVAKAKELNPLDQRKYDEMLAKERRRDLLAVQIGKAEEEASRARRNNCSHMRYGASAGKHAGELCPKGSPGGEFCTGGQAHQNGLVHLFCSRCNSEWWFQPTQDYYTFILQNGIDGIAPPPEEHTICIGCYRLKPECECSKIAKEHAAAHPTVA